MSTIQAASYPAARITRLPRPVPAVRATSVQPIKLKRPDIVNALETGFTGLVMVAVLLFGTALLRGTVAPGHLRNLGLDILDITTILTAAGTLTGIAAALFWTKK